ncbi:hypothetical protein F5876DRAFT_69035 [Lentinula aff. lateritia]|uniref:Uncharacterized protein n=1 Tax=Lentinula aff. lateritia TaxID=2804960 RepID=A0ACC1TNM6_9AGAR|nr:hypothetical protein F5876DRAFT_69035 [Lentinula aff. lateritia]
MRLRLQTCNTDGSKLPQLKVWFAFSAADEEIPRKSITDLKKSICTVIKSFSNADIIFRDIALGLDGFELLDELPAEDVLRDGDLLTIKRREAYTVLGKKRKAEDDGSTTAGKRHRPLQSKTRPRDVSSVSSSSSSSSSESDSSSSSSDSTTDSDSSTSSSSSSDSDSSTDLSKIFSKPNPPKSANIEPAPPIQQSHVPPGLGSIKTRKRNIRRRSKKKHDALSGQGAATLVPSPPKRISGVNVAPLGSKANNLVSARATTVQRSTDIVPINDPLNLTMFSLGNKNKKKGYKYALAPPTSQKKVFSVPDSSDALQEVEAEADVLNEPLPSPSILTSAPENPLARQARVIPPSELQSLGKLPKNMFVTSVDVEEDLWYKSSSKKKKKQQRLEHWEEDYTNTVREKPHDDQMRSILDHGLAEEHLLSPISETVLAANDLDAEDSKSMLIWSVVEQNFETFPQVSLDSLQNGKLVAWKALALNLETYSPEVLLHIATVTAVSNDSSGGNSSFSIRPLIRPGWEELDVENIQGDYTWENVEQMGWRAVNEIQRL